MVPRVIVLQWGHMCITIAMPDACWLSNARCWIHEQLHNPVQARVDPFLNSNGIGKTTDGVSLQATALGNDASPQQPRLLPVGV